MRFIKKNNNNSTNNKSPNIMERVNNTKNTESI